MSRKNDDEKDLKETEVEREKKRRSRAEWLEGNRRKTMRKR